VGGWAERPELDAQALRSCHFTHRGEVGVRGGAGATGHLGDRGEVVVVEDLWAEREARARQLGLVALSGSLAAAPRVSGHASPPPDPLTVPCRPAGRAGYALGRRQLRGGAQQVRSSGRRTCSTVWQGMVLLSTVVTVSGETIVRLEAAVMVWTVEEEVSTD